MKKSANSKKGAPPKGPARSDAAQSGRGRALLCTAGLIVAALVIIYLSSVILPQIKFIEDMKNAELVMTPHGEFMMVNSDLGSYFAVRGILSIINLALVVWLLYVYVKDYLRFRTSFALGIVAFLFSFLLYALSTLPFTRLLSGPGPLGEVFQFIPLLFSAVGLVVFAKLSNE
ncbi:Uncharacterised protein [uncultured archaeon]|nr:Uncharacterised protein [uncultured archaeon]